MKITPIMSRIPFLGNKNAKVEKEEETEIEKAQKKLEQERAEQRKVWEKLINQPQQFKEGAKKNDK